MSAPLPPVTAWPGFWMHETSGVLRPAVEAYFSGSALSIDQVGALRAYLRQWMAADWMGGGDVAALRQDVEKLSDRSTIAAWYHRALMLGIDPF